MVNDRLIVRPAEAAQMLDVSVRKFYDLAASVPDIRAAIVEIPGLRGQRVRVDLLRRAVEKLSPGVE